MGEGEAEGEGGVCSWKGEHADALCLTCGLPPLHSYNLPRLPKELLFMWVKTIAVYQVNNRNRDGKNKTTHTNHVLIHLKAAMMRPLHVNMSNMLALL